MVLKIWGRSESGDSLAGKILNFRPLPLPLTSSWVKDRNHHATLEPWPPTSEGAWENGERGNGAKPRRRGGSFYWHPRDTSRIGRFASHKTNYCVPQLCSIIRQPIVYSDFVLYKWLVSLPVPFYWKMSVTRFKKDTIGKLTGLLIVFKSKSRWITRLFKTGVVSQLDGGIYITI